MNRVFAAFWLALLFTTCAFAAPADDPALHKVFEARYAAVRAAIDGRDSKALAAFFAPDAVFVSVNCATATSDKILKHDMGRPADPHDQSHTTVLSAKRDGSTAIVEQINEMKTARPGPDGKPLNIVLRVGSTDTWVQIKGAWFVKRSVTHLLDYAVNGKSVRHMEAPKTCS
jgi:ketosteroid isomerase-like protein